MARQHHDYQREGNPVGYYVPGMDPLIDRGHTLILSHKNVSKPSISDKRLLDDVMIEITWEGKIIWEWCCSDHFEEMEFREEAKKVIYVNPNIVPAGGGMGDWMHINSLSILGPNRWFESGDTRFHPENIIWSSRESNIIAIINKGDGKIVWKVGPDYDSDPAKSLGWMIGSHHAHMISRGLPGEGNILIFDNGGWAGYGPPNSASPTGNRNVLRDYSRVLEINPATLEVVWEYGPKEAGLTPPVDSNRFYSPFISSAQRLPNGNTLITEGSGGRIIEVTSSHEVVWEFVNPYRDSWMKMNAVYRAYRVPYEWVPQLEKPKEIPIPKLDIKAFRVPNTPSSGTCQITAVEGTLPYEGETIFCVLPDFSEGVNKNKSKIGSGLSLDTRAH
jgi:hypothetical protein